MSPLFPPEMDGTAALEAGYPAAAAEMFRKTIALQPAASYYNLGIAFKDLSRAQDSVTSYLAALEHTGPHNFESCHFNIGRAFQMLADSGTRAGYLLRDHRERRDILLRAAHHFRRAGSHRSLEEVLHQLGDEVAARRAYVELLRRKPHGGAGAMVLNVECALHLLSGGPHSCQYTVRPLCKRS